MKADMGQEVVLDELREGRHSPQSGPRLGWVFAHCDPVSCLISELARLSQRHISSIGQPMLPHLAARICVAQIIGPPASFADLKEQPFGTLVEQIKFPLTG